MRPSTVKQYNSLTLKVIYPQNPLKIWSFFVPPPKKMTPLQIISKNNVKPLETYTFIRYWTPPNINIKWPIVGVVLWTKKSTLDIFSRLLLLPAQQCMCIIIMLLLCPRYNPQNRPFYIDFGGCPVSYKSICF